MLVIGLSESWMACWVLHPWNGLKPVAEGIAGGAPPPKSPEDGMCRSLLMELCEDGHQMVKVTKVHKKNTELMFPDENACFEFLDDYATAPPPQTRLATHLLLGPHGIW